MRCCVIGAGAIGGYLAARLALAGVEVRVVARGANLAALQQHGLILRDASGEQQIRLAQVSDDPHQLGSQDLVILAVKAQQIRAALPTLVALTGPDTIILPAQNGIPWWYFQKHGGPYEGQSLHSVDPDGLISRTINPDQVIGCVVYPATELVAPALIQHLEGDRFSLGELDGARTERIQQVSQLFARAGLKAPIRTRIRADIWVKLWGNLAFNPISALTRATLGQICSFPPTRQLAAAMMAEAQQVAERLGISFPISIEQRIDGAAQIGEHKTSMLQDIEARRTTEIDALAGSVSELGRIVGVPTPHIDAITAAVQLLERHQSAA
ncbi:MAG: 2-dehydropantoate 2-reductase [Roseiflexaceae bacterium]